MCVDLRPLEPRGGRRCFPKPRSPRPPRWPPPPERSSPASPGFRPSSSGCSSPYTRGEQRLNSSETTPHSLQSHFAPYVRQQRQKARKLSILLACASLQVGSFFGYLDGQISPGEMIHRYVKEVCVGYSSYHQRTSTQTGQKQICIRRGKVDLVIV